MVDLVRLMGENRTLDEMVVVKRLKINDKILDNLTLCSCRNVFNATAPATAQARSC